MKSQTPLVAVFMVTYNHSKYIAQAIESVLMQKTNFPLKLIIGEDYSTDKTREICIEYKNKFSDKIELILNEINLGPKLNANRVFDMCFKSNAKYIALLEGDDYWTDPNKLQKQINFLESHSKYSICFHHVTIVNEQEEVIFIEKQPQNIIYTQADFIYNNKKETRTCSMVFRSEFLPFPIPDWFFAVFAGDKFLKILLTEHGDAFIMKEDMACYRLHPNSYWSSQNSRMLKLRTNRNDDILIKHFSHKYPKLRKKLMLVRKTRHLDNKKFPIKLFYSSKYYLKYFLPEIDRFLDNIFNFTTKLLK